MYRLLKKKTYRVVKHGGGIENILFYLIFLFLTMNTAVTTAASNTVVI